VMGGSRSDAEEPRARRPVGGGRRRAWIVVAICTTCSAAQLHSSRAGELSGGALTGRWPEWRRQRGPLLPRS
jgi:hypothetical protein